VTIDTDVLWLYHTKSIRDLTISYYLHSTLRFYGEKKEKKKKKKEMILFTTSNQLFETKALAVA
jgi:hypothetical protein